MLEMSGYAVRSIKLKNIHIDRVLEAVETFMIDMDFFEVPKELVHCSPTNEFPMPENIPAGF